MDVLLQQSSLLKRLNQTLLCLVPLLSASLPSLIPRLFDVVGCTSNVSEFEL